VRQAKVGVSNGKVLGSVREGDASFLYIIVLFVIVHEKAARRESELASDRQSNPSRAQNRLSLPPIKPRSPGAL
jgi:hypothetical protein